MTKEKIILNMEEKDLDLFIEMAEKEIHKKEKELED